MAHQFFEHANVCRFDHARIIIAEILRRQLDSAFVFFFFDAFENLDVAESGILPAACLDRGADLDLFENGAASLDLFALRLRRSAREHELAPA